jgi:ATP phosphoribosyltransferase
MTQGVLILAIPSKGRLKEQVDGWLQACGFTLETGGGERGYRANLKGLPGAEVRLMSAGDIAAALDSGDIHLGVTGEDLLRETGEGWERRVMLLRALGFGRADLVVAAPQSWIDVETMADVEEVAHHYLARTGSRLRVATKYAVQTRAFFAARGIADYRIVDSGGATEGAPAAGLAELVVDITTTGATLAANNLKIIGGGVMLRSQAQLAASLRAPWTAAHLQLTRRLLSTAEARARAGALAALRWPEAQDADARAATEPHLAGGATRQPFGLLAPQAALLDIAAALAAAGVGPVSAGRPDYVFEASCPVADALAERVASR